MKDFTNSEDFPRSEIEFDLRFYDPSACYDYLFAMKWPNGFGCQKCKNDTCWISAKHLYICTKCNHQHSLTAGILPAGRRVRLDAHVSILIEDQKLWP